MIQTPERYWRVVGLGLDDFKKINPSSFNDSNMEKDTKQPIESTVRFGEKVSIKGGWYITVQVPETYISTVSFFQPKTGNKFIATSIEYANDSEEAGKIDPSNLTLRDKENQVYKTTNWGEKEPALDYDETVPAHDKIRGYVTFEVPESAEIAKVVYSNSRATIIIE